MGGMLNTQWLVTAGVWVAAFSLIGILIRQIVPWRKLAMEHDEHLRTDLLRRVERLERTLDRERIRHNSERALDRHRLNNVTQCFDALLLLIEMNPTKATEAVTKVKEMRATMVLAEAEEKAIIRAAEIEADEREQDHDGD